MKNICCHFQGVYIRDKTITFFKKAKHVQDVVSSFFKRFRYVDLVTFLSLSLIRNVEFLIAFIILRFPVRFSLTSFQEKILTFMFLIKMSQKISFVIVSSHFLCYAFICILEVISNACYLPNCRTSANTFLLQRKKWYKIVIIIEFVS